MVKSFIFISVGIEIRNKAGFDSIVILFESNVKLVFVFIVLVKKRGQVPAKKDTMTGDLQ